MFVAGEFEFRCKNCDKVIVQDLHKACNSMNNVRINEPHAFIDNVLYGFACGLSKCNYIQLSKESLANHLKNEHHTIPSDENIIEIILLKIVERIDCSKDSNSNTSLNQAKQRWSQYINYDTVESDDNLGFEISVSNDVALIDLTLSEDETANLNDKGLRNENKGVSLNAIFPDSTPP